jgi:hypothetical protein
LLQGMVAIRHFVDGIRHGIRHGSGIKADHGVGEDTRILTLPGPRRQTEILSRRVAELHSVICKTSRPSFARPVSARLPRPIGRPCEIAHRARSLL